MSELLTTLILILIAVAPIHALELNGVVAAHGRPVANAVVYLEGGQGPDTAPPHVVMDQHNLTFAPAVLPIVRGTTVEFTNSDDIQHNVFSPSTTTGKFDLGTYGPGANRSVTFDRPGEAVILCNIHMEMEARIIVLEQPYYGLTGNDGRYRIASVPPGHYVAKVWRGRFLPQEHPLDVHAQGETTLDLNLND